MQDRWLDRLSEYLDGELPLADRAELEAHLASCAECRGVLEELRQVVRTAAALQDEPPAHDLWPVIEARLGPVATHADARVISLVERRRRFVFTLPQLAAASVALMAGSAGLVWLLVSRGPGAAPAARVAVGAAPAASATTSPGTTAAAPVQAGLPTETATPAGETPSLASASGRAAAERTPTVRARLVRSTRPLSPEARATRDYNQAVADLQSVLRQERSRLKPETVKALEASLGDIDRAIADARRALARDPANVYLNAHLAESMRLKLELLQQVATITQS